MSQGTFNAGAGAGLGPHYAYFGQPGVTQFPTKTVVKTVNKNVAGRNLIPLTYVPDQQYARNIVLPDQQFARNIVLPDQQYARNILFPMY